MINFILLIGGSFILNLTSVKFLTNYYNSPTLVNDINTSIHSLVMCFLSWHYLNYHNYFVFESIMTYSIGHLIADSYYFHYKLDINKSKYAYIMHHITFILSWFLATQYSDVLDTFCILLFSEISIVPLNLKFYFKKKNNFYLEIFFGLLTYILFFRYRIINYSYYYCIFVQKQYYPIVIVFTPLLMLQYYWFTLMTRKIIDMSNIIPILLHIC